MIGIVLGVLVGALCWWIATDLDSSVTTQPSSYWSWLVTVDGGYTITSISEGIDVSGCDAYSIGFLEDYHTRRGGGCRLRMCQNKLVYYF